jgi:hypothetical protein
MHEIRYSTCQTQDQASIFIVIFNAAKGERSYCYATHSSHVVNDLD